MCFHSLVYILKIDDRIYERMSKMVATLLSCLILENNLRRFRFSIFKTLYLFSANRSFDNLQDTFGDIMDKIQAIHMIIACVTMNIINEK